MSGHWYDIIFVMLAVWIIADMIKPKEPKPPKVADLFWPKPKRPSVFMSPRLALMGSAVGVIGLLAVISFHW